MKVGNCLKEGDVGIIGSILGKRASVVEFRTVDGGHPAPYPDMTDEQLYNYEEAFNVPRRTFDKRPRASGTTANKSEGRHQAEASGRSEPQRDSGAAQQEKSFDAPRYTARAAKAPPVQDDAAPPPAAASASPATLDFSKPVRTITTKQPVDIITTRARHPIYKVHGYIGDDDVVTLFTLAGQISENGACFLENMPRTQQLHLNIYLNPEPKADERYLVTQHDTREAAHAAARPERLACVAVQFDL